VAERVCVAASGGQARLPGGVEAGTVHEPGDQASGTFRHTFTAPGSYRYSCTLHVGMNGRIDVGPGATP
jgi:plastocyanin